MPKVNFYLLSTDKANDKMAFVCRLVETIYKRSHLIHIHLNDQSQANELNDLLWTDKRESFIPHRLLNENSTVQCPITIGFGEETPSHHDTFINLGTSAPNAIANYSRVVEVISQEPNDLMHSRARYKHYQSEGYEIIIHDLKSSANKESLNG